MIETIYQAPTINNKMNGFENDPLYMSSECVIEILDALIIEEEMDFEPYVAPIDEEAINEANDWLKQAKYAQPTPTGPITRKQHLLNYQKEYYKKNQERRTLEMKYNYYTKRIDVLEKRIKDIEDDVRLTDSVKRNKVFKIDDNIKEYRKKIDDIDLPPRASSN
jgi:hypothetical protein